MTCNVELPHCFSQKNDPFTCQFGLLHVTTLTMASLDGNDEAAEARKKRKAILTQRNEELNADRQNDSGNEGGGRASSVASVASSDAGSHFDDGESSSKRSKRMQVRYDPAVPMDKDELANWRREHRRVRNRESAAASRQRIRSRITELEGEVTEWKDKYKTAVERLKNLREAASVSNGQQGA
jgi:hypothetical protein